MGQWQKSFPFMYTLFMKIAEPRVVRILHFGIYLCLIFAGLGVLLHPPHAFQSVLGFTLVCLFGLFILIGAIFGAFAVLPGIWWLERAGLIALITGIAMYSIAILALSASIISLAIPVAFILTFVLRWIEIRRYQLAPREE